MTVEQIVLLAYAAFLAIILVINLLYFFQIFKYRLPGDASLPLLILYVLATVTIVIVTDLLLPISR